MRQGFKRVCSLASELQIRDANPRHRSKISMSAKTTRFGIGPSISALRATNCRERLIRSETRLRRCARNSGSCKGPRSRAAIRARHRSGSQVLNHRER